MTFLSMLGFVDGFLRAFLCMQFACDGDDFLLMCRTVSDMVIQLIKV